MTYRDEEIARAAHVESLEHELADAERTARALEAALPESDENASARAHGAPLLQTPLGRAFGMTVGVIGGLATGFLVTGAGCLLFAYGSDGSAIDAAMSGSVAESTRSPIRPGDACIATVWGEDGAFDGCRARVMCGSTVLYEGAGTCGSPAAHELVAYWDRRDDDGTPACFISEHRHLAAIRASGWTATITSLAKQR